jgi:hypothetical protein
LIFGVADPVGVLQLLLPVLLKSNIKLFQVLGFFGAAGPAGVEGEIWTYKMVVDLLWLLVLEVLLPVFVEPKLLAHILGSARMLYDS